MKKLFFIGLLLSILFLISGCSCPNSCEDINPLTNDICSKDTNFQCQHTPKCPESCEDNNKCTNDICSESTNYECKYEEINPCCGNSICESGEYKSCSTDCPNNDLSKFVLNESDVSNDWEIESRGEISILDINSKYRQYGWQKGYSITFIKRDNSNIYISNYIHIYPEKEITRILRVIIGEMNTAKITDFTIQEWKMIDAPKFGDDSIIYKSSVDTDSPLFSAHSISYCLEFIEKDVLEELCSSDLELVKELGKKLDEKF